MTLKEKLEEITGGRVKVFFKDDDIILTVDDEIELNNCPTSWFNISSDDLCLISNDISDDYCQENCWGKEYKGEAYIGSPDLLKPVNDAVSHPSHYNAHNIEVIDFIQDWKLNFCLGNVVKYICRSPYKGKPLEDLRKAKEYLEFEIKAQEGMADENN